MTRDKILQLIDEHEWKEEEAQVSVYFLDHWKTTYVESKNAFNKTFHSVCVYSAVDNYAYEWARKDETVNALNWIFEQYENNRVYFEKKMREFNAISGEIAEKFATVKTSNLGGYSDDELVNLLQDNCRLGREQYGYSLMAEGLDTYTEDDFLKLLPGVEEDVAGEIIEVLSTPLEQGLVEQEHADLVRLAIDGLRVPGLKETIVQKNLSHVRNFEEFYNLLTEHVEKYFFIHNSFRDAKYLDAAYFIGVIADLIENKTEEELVSEVKDGNEKKKKHQDKINKIHAKYNVSPRSQQFFELVRLFAIVQDDRKKNVQQQVYIIDQIMNESARRCGVDKDDIDNYLVAELLDLIIGGNKVSKEKLEERKCMLCFSYVEDDSIKTDYIFGDAATEIINRFKAHKKELCEEKEIKGFVASIGNGEKAVRGTVRVIFDPHGAEISDGEILVTGMTRPEFVPLMKKAKAIVTNEGGITTHAAIVSRELKKPCVIGTKVATDLLQDGDEIEINLDNGTVIKK